MNEQQQRLVADDIEITNEGVRLVVEGEAPSELVHEPGAFRADGPCIPRVSLDCSACHESVIFCHISDAVIGAAVDPYQPPWRCSDCLGVTP